ncbi:MULTISPECIES: hypothetical protein [unclassified Acidocella]|uniref:hypothetical protein n=1 Tax=unclassified Acidocella TaxID=2648610 RepID=UPI00028D71DA|nr:MULTISPECIES: hypothetical protein [unclassified Acidocella]EKN00604.1 hypothetical protein MXAZACID_04577 [Acidocella sp. MX-AZ02]WBO60129.1 hypothetical protein GT370_04615 [Acidocella sp. MX-AZ03]
MDIQTIDNQYDQLQNQARQTVMELQNLAGKLQNAANAGDQNAREWFLDLKSIALAIQAEQNQVANLLQALHGFVANQAQQGYGQPAYPQQGYPQQGYAQPQQSGGILGGFLNSGFGRALEMGAGFGIGEDIINKIF